MEGGVELEGRRGKRKRREELQKGEGGREEEEGKGVNDGKREKRRKGG